MVSIDLSFADEFYKLKGFKGNIIPFYIKNNKTNPILTFIFPPFSPVYIKPTRNILAGYLTSYINKDVIVWEKFRYDIKNNISLVSSKIFFECIINCNDEIVDSNFEGRIVIFSNSPNIEIVREENYDASIYSNLYKCEDGKYYDATGFSIKAAR